MIRFLFALFILLLSYIVYNFIQIGDILKKPQLVNDKDCKVLRGALGIEDLVKYGKYIIGGSDDRVKLWHIEEEGVEKTPQGSIVVIDTTLDNKIKKIPISNFPKDVNFHPHGIYLYKNSTLYVINHAYQKGGERVEILSISEDPNSGVKIEYLRSHQHDDKFAGNFNDLAVIGEDEYYVSTWRISADNVKKGREASFSNEIILSIPIVLSIPLTHIYYCKGSNCSQVDGTRSLMNNGITYDGKETIYAMNVLEKRIVTYKINQSDRSKLIYLKDIDMGVAGDNVEYDSETGELIVGTIGRIIEGLNLQEWVRKNKKFPVGEEYKGHGGALSINTRKNNKLTTLKMGNEGFNGISTALKINNKVYMGSWGDDGVQICNIH
jgi:hypothetical protein